MGGGREVVSGVQMVLISPKLSASGGWRREIVQLVLFCFVSVGGCQCQCRWLSGIANKGVRVSMGWQGGKRVARGWEEVGRWEGQAMSAEAAPSAAAPGLLHFLPRSLARNKAV